jgi:hypothetical protein
MGDSNFPDTAPSMLPDKSVELRQAIDELVVDLGQLLQNPPDAVFFLGRLESLVDRIGFLMRVDTDGMLFVLFQRAQYGTENYSPAHALLCAVVCRLVARVMRMRAVESGALVGAALTMNIAMTALQNDLANQTTPLTQKQRDLIRSHAVRGRLQLAALGVSNELWLDIVATHHEVVEPLQGHALEQPAIYLPRILGLIDRYTSGLTPRSNRTALTSMQLAEGAHNANAPGYDSAAAALVKAIGVCPPGTYVRLVNDEIAVVVRQGKRVNQPLVASVLASNSAGHSRARLIDTERPEFMVNGGMLAADLDITLPDYTRLVRLLPKPSAP